MPAPDEIFFSYAWGDPSEQAESREQIVDDLYLALQKDGYAVVRDKYDLNYKGFISDFMTRIGKGRNVIVAISSKYLRSPYCMFELYEIARNSNFDKSQFAEKVFPITVEFIDFSKPAVLESHLAYWQSQFNEWDALVKTRSGSLSAEQFERYDKIKMVWQNFGKLADWLVDMNTLNPVLLQQNNFETIKTAISKNIHPAGSSMKLPFAGRKGCTVTVSILTVLLLMGGFAAVKFLTVKTNKPTFDSISTQKNNPVQSVSVFVHGKRGMQDMILRNQGYVLMDVSGGERKKADINENGVAYFQNLHVGDSVRLDVDFSEPYKSTTPDSIFVVHADGRLYLPVRLLGVDKIKGVVLYNDAPLQGVIISVDARKDTSDENGHFELKIPENEQRQQYTVWFNKAGFKAKSAPAFPQTGQDLNIVMDK